MVWFEVETKIRLDGSEVADFRRRIKEIAVFEKEGTKADDYFAVQNKLDYPKKAFRIRAMKNKFEVNFKKWLVNLWTKDIVVKQEFEFELEGKDQVEDLLELFRDLGFKEWVKKIKKNETYQYKKDKRASIEINNVKHLGYFIEIEYLCQPNELSKARNKIREVMKLLKVRPEQIDNTGYTKMLWYKGTKEKRRFLKLK
jgi:predicted adenylyl cyclase CyaB